ncbi:MAG: hypothetical protein Q3Y08_03865 [Butyricicoccus sp.]|nr:hypothetical protein [Butyricicoccus sp.]
MKLNMDIRDLIKGKKPVYPTKHSMNLYFKMDRTSAPATVALYLLFVLAILLGLAKFLVYDPWSTANQLEAQALALEEQTASALEQLQDYAAVQKEYIRIRPTPEEQAQVDCLEILNLIDQAIQAPAQIVQVSISENKVLLTFTGVTLEQSAYLVTQLEQSPLVANASVDTAASTEDQHGLVEIHVYFEAAQEEETQS